ncbi:MAG: cryptochrome/photolyase family protein [Chitinophagales bacterium]
MPKHKAQTLRLILGDQLNINHNWFKKPDDSVSYLLMEVRSETDYTVHHIQKVVAFFAAMRQFAALLQSSGHKVIYLKLNDKSNQQSFEKNIKRLIAEYGFNRFEWQLPDEYRLDMMLTEMAKGLGIPSEVCDTEHFLSSRNELADFFKGKKTYLMENFYRFMRRKHKVLMDGDEPLSGKWNYDESNRKKMPASHVPPAPLLFETNVAGIHKMVVDAGVKTIGEINPSALLWPLNRRDSLTLLDYFVKHCLRLFGTFQDAMTPQYWSLYHSRLSFALNVKLISPLEVINAAISQWQKHPDEIAFNQLEGFVRQIIGWREYMRGIYWAKMPGFAQLNYFGHNEMLPEWFWTGNTSMHCLQHSIKQSLHYAYAHHIQRLMVTGNFALLAGIHPDEVDAWYLGIYIDAIEWVEITNTRGMSQYADGGIVGSKPYVSSAAYINKMSNYCSSCYYKHDKRTGERACPFNSLYWNFYDRHKTLLKTNHRVGMMLKVWNNMPQEERTKTLEQAEYYLKNINEL